MALDHADIKKIARLARIYLTAAEENMITAELNHIFTLIAEIKELDAGVDLSKVASYTHSHGQRQFLREDRITAINQRELYQAVAPSVEDGFYLVPKVIE